MKVADMTWFKRKKKYTDDKVIAATIRDYEINRVGNTDYFTIAGVVWKFNGDSMVRQDGFVVYLSPTAAMFLGAHIVRMPVISIH